MNIVNSKTSVALRPDGDSASPAVAPVSSRDRIVALDILRGWAVFGMFVIHMTISPSEGGPWTIPLLDRLTFMGVQTFAFGKFVALFSILFGLGFVIQWERAQARGVRFTPFYLRRLAGLLIIALIAYIHIPMGDALILYALFGATFPLAIRVPLKWMPLLAFAVLLPALITQPMTQVAGVAAGAITSGSFAEYLLERASYLPGYFTDWFHFVQSMNYLTLMLIGMTIGRLGILNSLEENAARIRKFTPMLLGVGFLIAIVRFAIGPDSWAVYVDLQIVGSIILGLGYAGVILILLQYPKWQARLRPLGDVGRLAFSNYLLNSGLVVFFFHDIGIGLINEIGAFAGMIIAFAVFNLQMLFSTWWLKHFRYGPIEWIWRCLTYIRIVPIRPRPELTPAAAEGSTT